MPFVASPPPVPRIIPVGTGIAIGAERPAAGTLGIFPAPMAIAPAARVIGGGLDPDRRTDLGGAGTTASPGRLGPSAPSCWDAP